MALDGLLPGALTKQLKNGVPWVSVLLCSAGWALALTFTFERLITIDLVLYGAALLLEFAALVVLRVREPGLTRPFRIPGGLKTVIGVGVGPCVLLLFALWAPRGERVAGLPALVFGALVALAGPLLYLGLRPRGILQKG
jgi:amino acid transporter